MHSIAYMRLFPAQHIGYCTLVSTLWTFLPLSDQLEYFLLLLWLEFWLGFGHAGSRLQTSRMAKSLRLVVDGANRFKGEARIVASIDERGLPRLVDHHAAEIVVREGTVQVGRYRPRARGRGPRHRVNTVG